MVGPVSVEVALAPNDRCYWPLWRPPEVIAARDWSEPIYRRIHDTCALSGAVVAPSDARRPAADSVEAVMQSGENVHAERLVRVAFKPTPNQDERPLYIVRRMESHSGRTA